MPGKRRPELETIGRDISKLEKIETPFPRITYDEAVQMLQEAHAKGVLENKFEYGGDFGSPDETIFRRSSIGRSWCIVIPPK